MIFLILSVDDMNFFSSASSIFMISYTHCCCKFALLNVFDRKGLVWLMPVFKIWLVLPIMPSSYSRTFNLSKRQGIERGGVPVGTFYYIVIEVCSCQKKKKRLVLLTSEFGITLHSSHPEAASSNFNVIVIWLV